MGMTATACLGTEAPDPGVTEGLAESSAAATREGARETQSSADNAASPGPAGPQSPLERAGAAPSAESGHQSVVPVPAGLILDLTPYARNELPPLIDHGDPLRIEGSEAYLRQGGWIRSSPSGGNYSTRTWDEDALTITFHADVRWMRLTARSLEGPVDQAEVVRMAEEFVRLGWRAWYERYGSAPGVAPPLAPGAPE